MNDKFWDRFSLAITVSMILGFVLSVGIVNAEVKNPRIGVVDMQRALQTVKDGKKARSDLEKEFNSKKAELQKEEAEIKKMHEEFQKKSLALSDKARNERQQKIQERILKFQQKTAQSQAQIQAKEKTLTEPIVSKLREIIKKIADEKGYTMVLEKNENTVLFSMKENDLTEVVIKQYNK